MFNKLVMVGNLTRDIELRYTQSSMAIANTAIATTRKFTSNGEKKEEVCFIDITFFGRSAEVANQYLRKGSKILVEGRLKLDQWQDQNEQKRSKHGVIVETMQMLDSKSDNQTNDGYKEGGYNMPPKPQQYQPKNDGTTTQPTPTYEAEQGDGSYKAVPPPQQVPGIDINEDEILF